MGTPFSITRLKMIRLLVVLSLAVLGRAQLSGYSHFPYLGYNLSPYYQAAHPTFSYNHLPQHYNYNYIPAPVQAVSYAPAPYTVGNQFHAQDEFGNLNYGYSNINSMKQETGNTYGGVQGAYSYVDPDGELQRVEYVADALGFRVMDSRLPVAPTFNPEPLVGPEDTAEVKAARAAHMAALETVAAAAGQRKRREADPGFAYGFNSLHPQPHYFGVPFNTYNYNYAAPFLYHGLPYYG